MLALRGKIEGWKNSKKKETPGEMKTTPALEERRISKTLELGRTRWSRYAETNCCLGDVTGLKE